MGTFERGVGSNGATRSRCSRRRPKEVSDGSCCGARIGATILATSTPASAWRGVGVPVRLSVAHSLAARSPPDYRRTTLTIPTPPTIRDPIAVMAASAFGMAIPGSRPAADSADDRPRPGAIRFVWQWRELSPRQAFAKHQTSAKDISDVANRRRHGIPGWTRSPHKLASDRRPGRLHEDNVCISRSLRWSALRASRSPLLPLRRQRMLIASVAPSAQAFSGASRPAR
jgi:hypothetical protein